MSSVADELRKEGEEIGRAKGAREFALAVIPKLMKNLDMTMEQVMDAISFPEDERPYYRSQLQAIDEG